MFFQYAIQDNPDLNQLYLPIIGFMSWFEFWPTAKTFIFGP